jgi:predicted acylesterase/phospholipase RssA
LRSYDLPQKPNLPVTLSEAALATSAATSFFDPVYIGARQFVDGAIGANNPVEHVEGEARELWCNINDDVQSLTKCFLSIGTGNPGKRPVKDGALEFLRETLVQISTETEETGKRFAASWRQQLDQNRYFRLNVEQGLQGMRLEEYGNQGAIEQATYEYLDDEHQVSRFRKCVENLKQKQSVYLDDFS